MKKIINKVNEFDGTIRLFLQQNHNLKLRCHGLSSTLFVVQRLSSSMFYFS